MPYKKVGLGLEKTVNLWLDMPRLDRSNQTRINDINLGLLTAYLLKRNWKGRLNLIAATGRKMSNKTAQAFIADLFNLARMPQDTQVHYLPMDFDKALAEAPHADLNILVLPRQVDIVQIRRWIDVLETSCLFTLDSDTVNAFT